MIWTSVSHVFACPQRVFTLEGRRAWAWHSQGDLTLGSAGNEKEKRARFVVFHWSTCRGPMDRAKQKCARLSGWCLVMSKWAMDGHFLTKWSLFCGGFSFAEGNLMKMTQKQIWFWIDIVNYPEGIIYTMMRLSSNYPYQQRIKLDTNGALKFHVWFDKYSWWITSCTSWRSFLSHVYSLFQSVLGG